MDRRRFLAAAGTATTLPLAGCSLPTDAEPLTGPRTVHDPEAGEYVYEYGPDGREWVQYAVDFDRRERPNGSFEVTLVVSGFELGTTDVRFLVDPAPNLTGTVVRTRYLAKSWPPVTVSRRDGRTVLDVGGIDDPVDETLHFTLEVDPTGEGDEQAFVAVEAAFEGRGTFETYSLHETAVYDLPEPRSA